jgi:hypothetical protein
MLDCYSDDIVVHYGGTSPFAGTHHGRDRLVQLLVETAQRSGRELVTIDQVDDDDSHGALFVTETIRIGVMARGTGESHRSCERRCSNSGALTFGPGPTSSSGGSCA